MIRRIAEWLALTPTERNVILFLVGTLLVGGAIRLYQEAFPPAQHFEYREADSTFAALSNAIDAEESPEVEITTELLNVNLASKEQFIRLPGVGEILAQRIVEYRERAGRFSSADDLRKVKGISKKKLDNFKHLIIVH